MAGNDENISQKVRAWYNKGCSLLESGNFKQALDCFDKALEINPHLSEPWNNKGLCLANLGKYNEAIAFYDKALKINPEKANAWNNKGVVLSKLGKYEDSITCFDKALEMDRKYIDAWGNRAKSLGNLASLSEGIYVKAYEILLIEGFACGLIAKNIHILADFPSNLSNKEIIQYLAEKVKEKIKKMPNSEWTFI